MMDPLQIYSDNYIVHMVKILKKKKEERRYDYLFCTLWLGPWGGRCAEEYKEICRDKCRFHHRPYGRARVHLAGRSGSGKNGPY